MIGMRHPTSEARAQALATDRGVRRGSRPPALRTAISPIHRWRIHIEIAHVDRHGARGLVDIGDYQRAHLMSAARDGAQILNEGAFENDVRDGDKQSLVVDRGQKFFKRNGDTVVRRNRDHARAPALRAGGGCRDLEGKFKPSETSLFRLPLQ